MKIPAAGEFQDNEYLSAVEKGVVWKIVHKEYTCRVVQANLQKISAKGVTSSVAITKGSNVWEGLLRVKYWLNWGAIHKVKDGQQT